MSSKVEAAPPIEGPKTLLEIKNYLASLKVLFHLKFRIISICIVIE